VCRLVAVGRHGHDTGSKRILRFELLNPHLLDVFVVQGWVDHDAQQDDEHQHTEAYNSEMRRAQGRQPWCAAPVLGTRHAYLDNESRGKFRVTNPEPDPTEPDSEPVTRNP
jgi:hypothetical protein